jgi:hypothetical protein
VDMEPPRLLLVFVEPPRLFHSSSFFLLLP